MKLYEATDDLRRAVAELKCAIYNELPWFLRIPRRPDFVIGSDDRQPYLLRWYLTPWSPYCRKDCDGNDIEWNQATLWQKLVRTLPNVYLHQILRDDDDRALHDHPWPSVSVILKGGYFEVTPRGTFWRKPGGIYWRKASALHRLQLEKKRVPVFVPGLGMGMSHPRPQPCWTLFLTGFRLREWGFACPRGWVHWRKFTAKNSAGCGEA